MTAFDETEDFILAEGYFENLSMHKKFMHFFRKRNPKDRLN